MKKFICVMGALLMVIAAQAGVKQVTLAQTDGVTATYAAGTKTLTWSQGTSGLIITDDWGAFGFDSAVVSATFSGCTDLSTGNGLAKATFSSGLWTMDLSDISFIVDPENPSLNISIPLASVHLAGGIQGLYREEELPEGDALDGRAVVTVTTATFSGFDIYNLAWGNSLGLGGVISSVIFANGAGPDDYQSDYQSENATITLLADHTAIPEPMTMLLLGLGAVLLRKK
jgi:hypothetical protein